jgi:hypothetical protein
MTVTGAAERVTAFRLPHLASTAEGLTFTFVASSDLIATLDGLQYLDGGPCIFGAWPSVPSRTPTCPSAPGSRR